MADRSSPHKEWPMSIRRTSRHRTPALHLSKRRLVSLLAALATAVGLAVMLPLASTAAAACAAPYAAAQVYTGGMTASYNGHNWSAKWWTQGETPSTGGSGVWADQGACGGDGGSTPTPTPGSCNYPAWVQGQQYAT